MITRKLQPVLTFMLISSKGFHPFGCCIHIMSNHNTVQILAYMCKKKTIPTLISFDLINNKYLSPACESFLHITQKSL